MVYALDAGNREAGCQGQRQADRIDLAFIGAQHRRRDATGPGARRLHGPAAAIEADAGHGRRYVARADHHGKAQLEGAGVVAQHLLIFDFDDDALVGADIGHRRGEDVRTLGFQQAGLAPLVPSLLVQTAGFLALMNVALDDAGADTHAQAVDSGILG